MIVVASTCPDCGRIEIPIVRVILHVRDVPDRTRYSFTCPRCDAWISKPAGPSEVALLREFCCPERRERVPRELLEAHTGPPLNEDELIEFGLRLSRTDLVADAAADR